MAAALTLALAGLLALSAWAGAVPLMLAVALVQGLVVAGWYRAVDVPGALGGMLLAGVVAAATDLLLVVRDDPRPVTPATSVLGVAMVGGLVHQLTRRSGRERVTASLTATVTLAALVVLAALLVAARETEGAAALVVLVVAAAAAAALADGAPLPGWARLPAGLAFGAGAAALVGRLSDIGVPDGVLLGAAASVTTLVGGALVRRAAYPDLFLAAALPLAFAGPVAYVLGRILVG